MLLTLCLVVAAAYAQQENGEQQQPQQQQQQEQPQQQPQQPLRDQQRNQSPQRPRPPPGGPGFGGLLSGGCCTREITLNSIEMKEKGKRRRRRGGNSVTGPVSFSLRAVSELSLLLPLFFFFDPQSDRRWWEEKRHSLELDGQTGESDAMFLRESDRHLDTYSIRFTRCQTVFASPLAKLSFLARFSLPLFLFPFPFREKIIFAASGYLGLNERRKKGGGRNGKTDRTVPSLSFFIGADLFAEASRRMGPLQFPFSQG